MTRVKPHVGRRRAAAALASAALVLLLAMACTSMPPTVTPEAAAPVEAAPTTDTEAVSLTLEVTNTELTVGEERIAFRMYDPTGQELTGDDVDVQVQIFAAHSGEAVAEGPSLYFGLPAIGEGAWVTYTRFESSGLWILEVAVTRPDGWRGVGWSELTLDPPTDLPRVGAAPPAVDNPVAAEQDLSGVTSDPSPDPELYGITVAEAIDSGRPTVVHLGSPEHCPTALCRAVLNEIKAVKASYRGQVGFIHIESRDLTAPEETAAAAESWHLPSEPWTFVLDAHGRVANRIEGAVDRIELGLLLDRLLGIGQPVDPSGEGGGQAGDPAGQPSPVANPTAP